MPKRQGGLTPSGRRRGMTWDEAQEHSKQRGLRTVVSCGRQQLAGTSQELQLALVRRGEQVDEIAVRRIGREGAPRFADGLVDDTQTGFDLRNGFWRELGTPLSE